MPKPPPRSGQGKPPHKGPRTESYGQGKPTHAKSARPAHGKPAPSSQKKGPPPLSGPEGFMRELIRRMDGCETAESLNDNVLMPFVLAMEKVCGARGYVMNIYGETANLVFSGSEEDAEAIYQIVEAYMDDQADES